MDTITIKPARQSSTSSLPVRIGLVNYELIGTYENTRPMRVMALVRGMLINGYSGPAISVVQAQADTIFGELPDSRPTPINPANYGQIGVADGHHRLAAVTILDQLGLLQSSNVPVQFLPLRDANLIKMVTSEIGDRPLAPGEQPLTASDLEACYAHAGQMIPPKLTVHFDVKFNDGSFNWVRLGQPDIVIPRADFLRTKYDLDKLSQIIASRQFQPGQADATMALLSAAIDHAVER